MRLLHASLFVETSATLLGEAMNGDDHRQESREIVKEKIVCTIGHAARAARADTVCQNQLQLRICSDASFVCRSSNLFKQLDSRDLTPAEQAVIDQRVALQRRMFQAFEKQEMARKVLAHYVLLSTQGQLDIPQSPMDWLSLGRHITSTAVGSLPCQFYGVVSTLCYSGPRLYLIP